MRTFPILLLFLLLASCGVFRPPIPQPTEEFRAVWIATVANIDWPQRATDPWEKQQRDYLSLLDFYQALNFNAVIVQIRTAGDALYPTEQAPWSRYLTGLEGKAPEDPAGTLPWLIAEAHKRGMEFHAWLNPYRATMSLDTLALAPGHDFNRHRDWMRRYGNRFYYDPGIPEVQAHLVSIVSEVVERYPIDGIHFDDYFYPYRIAGETFPDSLTYNSYATDDQTLEHWRRANVDSLIAGVQRSLKAIKPWVRFGISPFGVWRNADKDPAGSDTRAGQTTYDDLYADPVLWMEQGWIDYLVPQLYWSMDFPPASHRKLVNWWATRDKRTRLYIGNGIYKIRDNDDEAWHRKRELQEQLVLARKTPEISGNVFFSAKSLPAHPDIARKLRKRLYRYPALPPPATTADQPVAAPPKVLELAEHRDWYELQLEESVATWNFAVLYTARNRRRLDTHNPRQMIGKQYLNGGRSIRLGKGLLEGKKVVGLTFLDAYGRESHPIIVHLDQSNRHGLQE